MQPDLLYFGGLIRSIKVARMAAVASIDCTPHISGGGLGFLYIAHFASCVPNIVDGRLKVPSGPGLGVELDPDFLKRAVAITA